ncbi:MAG: hypothetical protein HZA48_02180 [Planctomycetes bacterium]|nr:hypothetical protein [Planctomycetota bacterium]
MYLFLPFFTAVFTPFALTQTEKLKWRLILICLPAVIVFAASLFNPQMSLPGNFKALLINLSFVAFTVGVALFFRAVSGKRAVFAQFASTAFILFFSFSVFWANPLIEAYRNSPVRDTLIYIAVNFNPMVTAYAHGYGADMLRQKLMYDISLIGPYYPYHVAGLFTIILSYLIPGAFLTELAFLKYKLASRNEV